MTEPELKAFLNTGLEIWKHLKKDFPHRKAMSDFLMESYPVIVCGHHQIDLDLARNLYKPLYSDEKKVIKPEERKAEELRQRVAYSVENGLESLSLEARFPSVDIELIEELRAHATLKDINHSSRASVRVIIFERVNYAR